MSRILVCECLAFGRCVVYLFFAQGGYPGPDRPAYSCTVSLRNMPGCLPGWVNPSQSYSCTNIGPVEYIPSGLRNAPHSAALHASHKYPCDRLNALILKLLGRMVVDHGFIRGALWLNRIVHIPLHTDYPPAQPGISDCCRADMFMKD